MKIYFPLGPNAEKQAHRGVGRYYQYLKAGLEKISTKEKIEIVSDSQTADIIHYTYFDLFFHSLPVFNQNKKNQRTIVTIHDVIPLVFPEQYPPGKKGALAFNLQKLALKKVDSIITDSKSSKSDIIKYLRYPADKIYPVYLAANPHLQPADENAQRSIRQKYHLRKNYLLYVGDINYNKNLPQLIKSLKFLPEKIQLVCVGKNFTPQNIPEWKAIEEQVTLSQVSNRVHFLTQILGDDADKQLSALYSGAICYVQPSLYEGFGLPILEGMQCRTPVVCPANSSQIEVGGKQAIFIENTDALSIAEAVKEIIAWTPEQREKHLNAAAKYAATFSWEKVAKETLKVYQQTLAN